MKGLFLGLNTPKIHCTVKGACKSCGLLYGVASAGFFTLQPLFLIIVEIVPDSPCHNKGMNYDFYNAQVLYSHPFFISFFSL